MVNILIVLSFGEYYFQISLQLTSWPSQSSLLVLPSAVQSTFAMVTASLSAYLAANSSHVGANLLQCPHHGAKNLTNVTPRIDCFNYY